MLTEVSLPDLVVWEEEAELALLRTMKRNYGTGPFKVVGIRLDRSERPQNPYIVQIEIVHRNRKPKYVEFTGALFKRAKPTARSFDKVFKLLCESLEQFAEMFSQIPMIPREKRERVREGIARILCRAVVESKDELIEELKLI